MTDIINLIVYLFLSVASAVEYTENNVTYTHRVCSSPINIDYWDVPPYIYKDEANNQVKGIFKTIVEQLIMENCLKNDKDKKECTKDPIGISDDGKTQYANDFGTDCPIKFYYTPNPADTSEKLKARMNSKMANGGNKSISMPIYGKITQLTFRGDPYFPVIESPGIVFLSVPADTSNAALEVMKSILSGYPVLVLTLVMALLSGIVMWALDSYWNPEEFPASFFRGTWEGFWWAFISMTTVGYGDRAPKSFLARVFAFFWVLVGLVIISIFTATVTSSLTAMSSGGDAELYGNTLWALENTEEQRYGVANNAKMLVSKNVSLFTDNLVNTRGNAIGGLIDSYVAGYYRDTIKPSKAKGAKGVVDNGLRVGKIFEHPYTYGFVMIGELGKDPMDDEVRKTLSTKEGDITELIQNNMQALPENDKSAAEESAAGLFDPSSDVFQKACYGCCGLIVFFSLIGIAWEHLYWRPKLRRSAGPKKLVEPTNTGYKSQEELVAVQGQELEDAMILEVTAFYKGFNEKLRDIRTRHQYAEEDSPAHAPAPADKAIDSQGESEA